MSAHTSGPWHFSVAYNGDCGVKANGTGVFAEAFADIRHSGENAKDEARANARLIAAAPDMLRALQDLSSLYDAIWVQMSNTEQDLCKAAWAQADAAIAKATGAA